MAILRIVIDGELIWEGEVDDHTLMTSQETYHKPVLKPVDYFAPDESYLQANTFMTETGKLISVVANTTKEKETVDPWVYGAAKEVEVSPPKVPVPSNEEIADALEKAADLFLTDGWAQGALKLTKKQMEEYEEDGVISDL